MATALLLSQLNSGIFRRNGGLLHWEDAAPVTASSSGNIKRAERLPLHLSPSCLSFFLPLVPHLFDKSVAWCTSMR